MGELPDRIAPLTASVVRDIVRKLVEAHGELSQMTRAIKDTLRTVAVAAGGTKALRDAARREMWYVLSLAPMRVLPTKGLLGFMTGAHAASVAQEVIRAARSTSNALMPRIAELAPYASAEVAGALGEKLMRSMKMATVDGRPMYGTDDAVLRSLAQSVIKRLATRPYPKLGGMDGLEPLELEMESFLSRTPSERVAHILNDKDSHGPLCIWDVSRVVSLDNACSVLFTPEESGTPDASPKRRHTFNSDLFWDTSSVDTMIGTFEGNSEFSGDLSSWDVRQVRVMDRMFRSSGIVDSGIRNWDVARVVHARSMFEGAPLHRALDLSRWSMPKARFLMCMFKDSGIVDSGVGGWLLPGHTHTRDMFEGTHFVGTIGTWTDLQKREALQGVLSGTKYGSRGATRPQSGDDARGIEDLYAMALGAQTNERGSACAVS
jgi:hypothetical protein